jgi:hypothetical protein
MRVRVLRLVIAALCLGACGGSDSPTGPDDQEWPVTYKLNGTPISSSGWTTRTSTAFIIRGDNGVTGAGARIISLILPAQPQVKTYSLGSFNASPSGPFASVNFGTSSAPGPVYFTQSNFVGTVTVTAYNPATDEISGTFSFSAAPEPGITASPATITVTEGVFHATAIP